MADEEFSAFYAATY
jgi:RNA polymerase sigma-70 factor, ECF subfamily